MTIKHANKIRGFILNAVCLISFVTIISSCKNSFGPDPINYELPSNIEFVNFLIYDGENIIDQGFITAEAFEDKEFNIRGNQNLYVFTENEPIDFLVDGSEVIAYVNDFESEISAGVTNDDNLNLQVITTQVNFIYDGPNPEDVNFDVIFDCEISTAYRFGSGWEETSIETLTLEANHSEEISLPPFSNIKMLEATVYGFKSQFLVNIDELDFDSSVNDVIDLSDF